MRLICQVLSAPTYNTRKIRVSGPFGQDDTIVPSDAVHIRQDGTWSVDVSAIRDEHGTNSYVQLPCLQGRYCYWVFSSCLV